MKDHLLSIRKHINDLSTKNYQNIYEIESLDFVLMFSPIEQAFYSALEVDSQLCEYALEKNVIITTPTNLMVILRTINSMWTIQRQQKNALEIARQAGLLYDKFVGFITDLTQVGVQMNKAIKSHEGAMNKLSTGGGNLVGQVEKLKEMGAKAKKSLPQTMIDGAKEHLEHKIDNAKEHLEHKRIS